MSGKIEPVKLDVSRGPLDGSGVRVKAVFDERIRPGLGLPIGGNSVYGELTVNGQAILVEQDPTKPEAKECRALLIPLSRVTALLVLK
jgi:hypothetical protein